MEKSAFINFKVKLDGNIVYVGTNKFEEQYIVVQSVNKRFRYSINLKNKFAYDGHLKISFPEGQEIVVYDSALKSSIKLDIVNFALHFNVEQIEDNR